jgi:hypothetical protein
VDIKRGYFTSIIPAKRRIMEAEIKRKGGKVVLYLEGKAVATRIQDTSFLSNCEECCFFKENMCVPNTYRRSLNKQLLALGQKVQHPCHGGDNKYYRWEAFDGLYSDLLSLEEEEKSNALE